MNSFRYALWLHLLCIYLTNVLHVLTLTTIKQICLSPSINQQAIDRALAENKIPHSKLGKLNKCFTADFMFTKVECLKLYFSQSNLEIEYIPNSGSFDDDLVFEELLPQIKILHERAFIATKIHFLSRLSDEPLITYNILMPALGIKINSKNSVIPLPFAVPFGRVFYLYFEPLQNQSETETIFYEIMFNEKYMEHVQLLTPALYIKEDEDPSKKDEPEQEIEEEDTDDSRRRLSDDGGEEEEDDGDIEGVNKVSKEEVVKKIPRALCFGKSRSEFYCYGDLQCCQKIIRKKRENQPECRSIILCPNGIVKIALSGEENGWRDLKIFGAKYTHAEYKEKKFEIENEFGDNADIFYLQIPQPKQIIFETKHILCAPESIRLSLDCKKAMGGGMSSSLLGWKDNQIPDIYNFHDCPFCATSGQEFRIARANSDGKMQFGGKCENQRKIDCMSFHFIKKAFLNSKKYNYKTCCIQKVEYIAAQAYSAYLPIVKYKRNKHSSGTDTVAKKIAKAVANEEIVVKEKTKSEKKKKSKKRTTSATITQSDNEESDASTASTAKTLPIIGNRAKKLASNHQTSASSYPYESSSVYASVISLLLGLTLVLSSYFLFTVNVQ